MATLNEISEMVLNKTSLNLNHPNPKQYADEINPATISSLSLHGTNSNGIPTQSPALVAGISPEAAMASTVIGSGSGSGSQSGPEAIVLKEPVSGALIQSEINPIQLDIIPNTTTHCTIQRPIYYGTGRVPSSKAEALVSNIRTGQLTDNPNSGGKCFETFLKKMNKLNISTDAPTSVPMPVPVPATTAASDQMTNTNNNSNISPGITSCMDGDIHDVTTELENTKEAKPFTIQKTPNDWW